MCEAALSVLDQGRPQSAASLALFCLFVLYNREREIKMWREEDKDIDIFWKARKQIHTALCGQ